MTRSEVFWSWVALIVFGTLVVKALFEEAPWALGVLIGLAVYVAIGLMIAKNEEEERGPKTDRGQAGR